MIKKNLDICIVVFILIIIIKLPAQITFSEVMYDVATNEYHDEFIELFNLSYTDSIDITGWQFSDSAGSDHIIPLHDGSKIPPRSFALILDGSYPENSSTYDTIIPDTVMLLTISDNSLGNNGLSNSQSELLSIINSTGDTLNTYRYTVGNIPGFSDEKILLDGGNDSSNWRDSKKEGGTPGGKNSVTPPDFDLGFAAASFIIPDLIFENESVQVEALVHNYGMNAVSGNIEIQLFSDRNTNYMPDEKDMIHDTKYFDISNWNFPQIVELEWSNIQAGEHLLVLRLNFTDDENPENDFIYKIITVLSRGSHLHINEIKFLTLEEEPEWIELINSGYRDIYLKGWRVADHADTALIDTYVCLSPGQMKVIAKDSLPYFYCIEDSQVILVDDFPTLNNTGDEITLIEPAGSRKERINYSIDWLEGEQNNLASLERINPNLYENKVENWGPCVSPLYATPGKQNSVYTDLIKKRSEVHVAPNPFSPDGDAIDDVTIISIEIPEASARIKAQIFDIKGRLIRTLRDNRFTGSHFNLVWDGKDQDGHMARIGIYIIYIQTLNDWQGIIRELKASVVLAHKL